MNGYFKTSNVDAAIGLICDTNHNMSNYVKSAVEQAVLLHHENVDYYHLYLGILCNCSYDAPVMNATLGQNPMFFASAIRELVAPGKSEPTSIDAPVGFVALLYSVVADSRILGSAEVENAHFLCHILANPDNIISHIYKYYLNANPRSIIESIALASPQEFGRLLRDYYLGLYDLYHTVYSSWRPRSEPTG